jgi:hypothetical protein
MPDVLTGFSHASLERSVKANLYDFLKLVTALPAEAGSFSDYA